MVNFHEILSRQSRAFDTDLSNVEDVMPCQWRDFNPAIKHTCKVVGSDIISLLTQKFTPSPTMDKKDRSQLVATISINGK